MHFKNIKLLTLFIAIIISSFLFPAYADTIKSPVIDQWVEIGPNNAIIVRALTTDTTCPIIKLKHHKQITMDVRQLASANFPFTVCQATVPPTDKNATINGITLALPPHEINRIVVIGDSGCSIKSTDPQACNDIKKWPFPNIAAHAAAWKPDLVIHVGDYLYREHHCPKDFAGCKGSPHGDNWGGWQADFFQPADPLLHIAPWIFVRGNHETCDRAGNGWSLLLMPFELKPCDIHEPLYNISIDNMTLFIIDSAYASDLTALPDEVAQYDIDMRLIADNPSTHKWIVTHKPFWFVYEEGQLSSALQSHFMNTLQTAWSDVTPENVDVFLSGHVHRFQTINFAQPGRPPQIIVGASGARLNTALVNVQLKGFNLAGIDVTQGISFDDFGYLTLLRQKDTWIGQIHNPDGIVFANCTLQDRQFICQETPARIAAPVQR